MFGSLFGSLFGSVFKTTSKVVETATFGVVDLDGAPTVSPVVPLLPQPTPPVSSDEDEVIGPDDDADEVAAIRADALVADTGDYGSDISAVNASENYFLFFDRAPGRGIDKGSSFSDKITGGNGRDKLFGLDGNDIIKGKGGADRLNGGNGNDKIYGGTGQDILEGGRGYDVLRGGADIDVFIHRKGCGTTTIEDFTLGFDVLDLEGYGVALSESYERLVETGVQRGDDAYFYFGGDLLILQNADLSTMVADDLCIR